MGWSIHVDEVTRFRATCSEFSPPVSTPEESNAALAAGKRCEWSGPERGNEHQARADADAHWHEHQSARHALNEAWDALP